MRKVEDASEKAVTKVFAGTSKTKAATQTASKSTPKADLWSKYSDKKVASIIKTDQVISRKGKEAISA